jgi:hypothetical protein
MLPICTWKAFQELVAQLVEQRTFNAILVIPFVLYSKYFTIANYS